MLTHELTEEERGAVIAALLLLDPTETVLALIDGFSNATEVVLR